MISAEELKILEKREHDKMSCGKPGRRILARIAQQLKDSESETDNWADYQKWDQYSVWSKD